MHPLGFLAVTVLGQLCASAFVFNQSCQQLIEKLRIDDATNVALVQDACQSPSNDSSMGRIRKACEISYRVFQSGHPGMGDLTEYIGPRSRFFKNRTESNWSVKRIPASWRTLQHYTNVW